VIQNLIGLLLGEHNIANVQGSGGKLQNLLEGFHVEWPLLIAQTLNFCIVAYVLYRFAFKPLASVIAERQRKISDGLQYAEEMEHQLAEVEVSRGETLKEAARVARASIEEARRNCEAIRDQEMEKLAIELNRIRQAERDQIERERRELFQSAQRELAGEAAKLARQCLEDDPVACEHFTKNSLEKII
jgi:F-type H+-transporting ATPase subunit b